MKIALRKNKVEKVAKIRERLEELTRLGLQDDTANADADDRDDAEYVEDRVSASTAKRDISKNQVSVTLPPNAVQKISATFIAKTPRSTSTNQNASSAVRIEALKGTILVFEHNNQDYIREVSYYVRICKDEDIYRQACDRRLKFGFNFRSLYASNSGDDAAESHRRLISPTAAVSTSGNATSSNMALEETAAQTKRSQNSRSAALLRRSQRSGSTSPVQIPFMSNAPTEDGAFVLRAPRRFLFGVGQDSSSRGSLPSSVSNTGSVSPDPFLSIKSCALRVFAPPTINSRLFKTSNERNRNTWSSGSFVNRSKSTRPPFFMLSMPPDATDPIRVLVKWKPTDTRLNRKLEFQVRMCEQLSFAERVRRRLRSISLTDAQANDVFSSLGLSHVAGGRRMETQLPDGCVEIPLKPGDTVSVSVCWVPSSLDKRIEWPVSGSIELMSTHQDTSRTLPVRICSSYSPLAFDPPVLIIPATDHSGSFSIINHSALVAEVYLKSPSLGLKLGETMADCLLLEIPSMGSRNVSVHINDNVRSPSPLIVRMCDFSHCHDLVVPVLAQCQPEKPCFYLATGDGSLDLGNCLCSNSALFERVIPIELKSEFTTPMRLTATTNAPTQVAFFVDEPCTSPLVPGVSSLAPAATTKIFARLRVGLDLASVPHGKCRQMICGISLEARNPQDKSVAGTVQCRLSATIGDAVVDVRVPDNDASSTVIEPMGADMYCIDLGVVSANEAVQRHIELRNLSQMLPLQYSVSPPEGIKVSSADTSIASADYGSRNIAAGATHELILTIDTKGPGCFENDMFFHLVGAERDIKVRLRCFIDPGIISVQLPIEGGYHCLNFGVSLFWLLSFFV